MASERLLHYADWLRNNKDKQDSPEFEKVATAYRKLRATESSAPAEQPPAPATSDVVVESLKRVPVGIAESFAQFPENVQNLGKMAYGTAVTAAGRPDLAPVVTAPEPIIENALTKQGYLKSLEGMTPSQKLLSSAVQGGAAGLINPVQGFRQAGANVLKGAVAGGVGEGVSQATGNELAGIAASMAVPGAITKLGKMKTEQLANDQKLNAVRDQTIKESRDAGYVLPTGAITPNMKNVILESIAGKTALEQAMSVKNQKVTDQLARKAVGIADDAPLTPETMKSVRADEFEKGYAPLKQIGQVGTDVNYLFDLNNIKSKYAGAPSSFPGAVSDDIRNLVDNYKVNDFQSRHALDEIKRLRDGASDSFRKGETGLAKAQKEIANALERQIERHLDNTGTQDAAEMLNNFKSARQRMAISHAVEDAIHKGSGTLDAKELAKAYRNDKYLSGELETIAKFANTFQRVAQTPSAFGTPGANKMQAGLQVLGAGLGSSTGGVLGGAFGAAAPVAIPFATRQYLMSEMNQRKAAPSYRSALANIASQDITQPQLLNALLGLQQSRQ